MSKGYCKMLVFQCLSRLVSLFVLSTLLKHSWDESVRHSVRVLLPVFAVFAAAAVLVPHTAVHQQDGHVNDIKVREQVTESAGRAVGQRSHQVPSVVKMPGHAPEASGEQFAFVDASVGRAVGALDVGRLAAPDGAGSLCASEQVLLVVRGAEDVITSQTKEQNGRGVDVRELDGMVDQVQALQRVEIRQPHTVSPAQHPSKVIMADVNGLQVPCLIPKEIQHINGL